MAVGNTSYDLVDGVPATARFVAQMSRAFYRKAAGQRPEVVGGVTQTPYALARDFLRRRLSPSAQAVADVSTGRNVNGGQTTVGGAMRDALVPFVVDEMYKGWVDAGGSSTLGGDRGFKTGFRGAAKGLPSAVGVPSSTYQERGETLDLSDIAEPEQ